MYVLYVSCVVKFENPRHLEIKNVKFAHYNKESVVSVARCNFSFFTCFTERQ